jgi:hypothetical protein
MLFETLFVSGLAASAVAAPSTKRQDELLIPHTADVSISTNTIWTGSENPYDTFHHAYDLCDRTHCREDDTVEYTVGIPQSGGVNHQHGQATLRIKAEGTYNNANVNDWVERNSLIEILASTVKAASVEEEYTIQVGMGCSAKSDFCNSEPKIKTIKYWRAPRQAKAVIQNKYGETLGALDVTVEFEAHTSDFLALFTCDNVKSAGMGVLEKALNDNPWTGALGVAGDILCSAL